MRKLLLVDDEVWALAGLQTIINWKDFGFEICDCCSCGEDAYESILQNRPDVVFTDIRMPDITGIELIARIREQGIDTPVVITSGYSDFDVACEAIRYNAYQYLLKPLEKEKVAQVAESLSKKLQAGSGEEKPGKDPLCLEQYGFALSNNATVAEIQRFLARNYTLDITLRQLAQKFFLTETYLCDLFKRQTGATVSSFVRNIRLYNACDLMADSRLQLSAIAEAVGYKDYSYFGKLFKNKFGQTPEEYRKQSVSAVGR